MHVAVEESMPAQIAEYEEAKRTESVSSATDRVSEMLTGCNFGSQDYSSTGG